MADVLSFAPNNNFIHPQTSQPCIIVAKLMKKTRVKDLETDIDSHAKWASETNLVFNTDKTEFLLIRTSQMSTRHKLKNEQCKIC